VVAQPRASLLHRGQRPVVRASTPPLLHFRSRNEDMREVPPSQNFALDSRRCWLLMVHNSFTPFNAAGSYSLGGRWRWRTWRRQSFR